MGSTGQQVRAARSAANLTQRELAERSGDIVDDDGDSRVLRQARQEAVAH